ncbi:MAG: hydrogenase maturation protease [Candidatus Limnocylindrales bacterium]
MSERPKPGRVHVLLCGERLRGDDAAAPLAAGMLPADVLALATVIELTQLGIEALLDVPAEAAVVVADAAVGIPAGRIVVLPLEAVVRSAGRGASPASSHALPPHQVLALAAELRGSPARGTFVGIGASEFGFGETPSEDVLAAMPAFAAAIAAEIRRLAATPTG